MEQSIVGGADVFVIAPELRTAESNGVLSSLPPLAYEDVDEPVLSERLRESLFYLTGGRMGPDSFCRFQAKAISVVLEYCEALVLLHHDKHDYCIGIYTKEQPESVEMIQKIEESLACLAVPFSIPPMLARWDRAIWELRRRWDSEKNGPFPIPMSKRTRAVKNNDAPDHAEEGSAWQETSVEQNKEADLTADVEENSSDEESEG